jgi:hypothetical protein
MNIGNSNKIPCTETVCESRTITEVQSESVQPTGRYGPLIAQIPVLVSKNKVDIHVEVNFNLEFSMTAIRNCTRDVSITQCKLLDLGNQKNGKLYLNGYIRENIEYAAANAIKYRNNSGEIRYKVVKVPFECTAKIDYYTAPTVKAKNRFINIGLSAIGKIPENPYDAATTQNLEFYCPGSGYRSANMFCELDEVNILESHDLRETALSENKTADKRSFDTFAEYIVISITFTLAQWQWVNIPRHSVYNGQYQQYIK